MDFRRKFYDVLLDWKHTFDGKNAILIEGARRIGKSTIAETFAKNEYRDYILLDFARESPDVKRLFADGLSDMDSFFNKLFVLKQKELAPRESVIILDEIQLFPTGKAGGKIPGAGRTLRLYRDRFPHHHKEEERTDSDSL